MCEVCETYDGHMKVAKAAADKVPELREDLLKLAGFLKKERDGSVGVGDDSQRKG